MIYVEQMLISEITPEIYDLFYARISPERQVRAMRYKQREDKLRCVAGEILLRHVLKKARDLTEMTVECNAYGKPAVKGIENFYYNLSHSGDRVVIAYGDSEVGIDVEPICINAAKESIAKRHFTENEYKYIFEGSTECTAKRFCEIWTAKESYVKYLGIGLRIPLNSFDVLNMKEPLFHCWTADSKYCVTVCSMDKNTMFETVDIKKVCL